MSVLNLLIVGGGISGLTAAAAFGTRGTSVDLVEIRGHIGDLGGVGLSIMGNASKVLAGIGVADECVRAGMPADVFTVRTHTGEVIGDVPWPPLGKPDWPNQVGISRADFHSILAQAARSAGARMTCGVTVESIEQDAEAAHVTFTDGRIGHYDLVIGADGLNSNIRRMMFPEAGGPNPVGLSIWRAYVPRPDGVTKTQLHFDGPQALVGICPINHRDCYVYCMHPADRGEKLDPETLHLQLRERLAGYGGVIPDLSAQLNDPGLVSYRPLEWFLLPSPWFRGRVVLIGDAVHTNPPNIGQGAAMGMEDAVVLAEETGRPGSLDDALRRFMERRFERSKLVVETSCNIARAQARGDEDYDAGSEVRRASAALAEPY